MQKYCKVTKILSLIIVLCGNNVYSVYLYILRTYRFNLRESTKYDENATNCYKSLSNHHYNPLQQIKKPGNLISKSNISNLQILSKQLKRLSGLYIYRFQLFLVVTFEIKKEFIFYAYSYVQMLTTVICYLLLHEILEEELYVHIISYNYICITWNF